MRILRIGIITLISLALLWTAAFAVAKWNLDTAIQKNAALLGHPASIPATSSNETAKRIAEASTAIGFPLKIRDGSESLADSLPAKTTRTFISNWVNEQTGSTSTAAGPLPAEIASFLSSNAEALHDLDTAIDSGRAVWEFEPVLSGPLPNLLAHISIVRMYAARSLGAEFAGRHEEAWEHLRRASMLADALSERPELISNLISLAELGIIARTSIHLSAAAPEWAVAMSRRDISRQFARSEAFEMYMLNESLLNPEALGLDEAPTLYALALEIFMLPADMFEMKGWVEERRPLLESLVEQGGCSFGPADESQLHSMAVRYEIMRRELELARLVYAARSGESVAPQSVCGYAWTIDRDDSEIRFAIPDEAPRRQLGVEVREFHVALPQPPVQAASASL